jgi:2-oxoisovalerate ferredoxin oxidoreductase alpha subunit
VKKVITGNYALAYGAMLSKVDVVAAYPITPQTTVVEKLAQFQADGQMKTQYIHVESEHTAMAALISAAMVGARTFTATSAHGLLLMHEMLFWASGARTPVVMGNINRAIAPPWSVWADHTDSIAQRDTGWLQFFCENNQEVLDTVLIAYKVCEDKDILLPAMLSEDAFYLSHTSEPVDIYDQALVDEFLPPFDPPYKIDFDNPKLYGSLVPPVLYMEFRYKIFEAMNASKGKLKSVYAEFEKKFGRRYHDLELYGCEDADVVLLGAGTLAATAKEVVDEMKKAGKRVGFARLRTFRPFPTEEIRELAKNVDVLGVLDRSYTFGYGGAFFGEVGGVLANSSDRPILKSYIVGIGGRDITPKTIEKIFDNALMIKEKGLDREEEWIDLKV